MFSSAISDCFLRYRVYMYIICLQQLSGICHTVMSVCLSSSDTYKTSTYAFPFFLGHDMLDIQSLHITNLIYILVNVTWPKFIYVHECICVHIGKHIHPLCGCIYTSSFIIYLFCLLNGLILWYSGCHVYKENE